ncbi:hypothetical protein JCM10213v2_001972 [Rhodosporidiobolus nylandii]
MDGPPSPVSAANEQLRRERAEEKAESLQKEKEELAEELERTNTRNLKKFGADLDTRLRVFLTQLRFILPDFEPTGATTGTSRATSESTKNTIAAYFDGAAAPAAVVYREGSEQERAELALDWLDSFISPSYLDAKLRDLAIHEEIWQKLTSTLDTLHGASAEQRDKFSKMHAETVYGRQLLALRRFIDFLNAVKSDDSATLSIGTDKSPSQDITADFLVLDGRATVVMSVEAKRNEPVSRRESQTGLLESFPCKLRELELKDKCFAGGVTMGALEAPKEGTKEKVDRPAVLLAQNLAVTLEAPGGRCLSSYFLNVSGGFMVTVQPLFPLPGYVFHPQIARGELPSLLRRHPAYMVIVSPFKAHQDPARFLSLFSSFVPLKETVFKHAKHLIRDIDLVELRTNLLRNQLTIQPSANTDWLPNVSVRPQTDGGTGGSGIGGSRSGSRASGERNDFIIIKEDVSELLKVSTLRIHFASPAVDHRLERKARSTHPPSATSSPPPSRRCLEEPATPLTLAAEWTFLDLFLHLVPIGRGAGGAVYTGQTVRGSRVVLKYAMTEEGNTSLAHEAVVYAALEAAGANVAPRLFGLFRGGRPDQTDVLVLEQFGQAVKSVDDLSRHDRLTIVALHEELHRAGYAQDDYAERNTVIDPSSGLIKLIDFGEAEQHDCPGKTCCLLDEIRQWLEVEDEERK